MQTKLLSISLSLALASTAMANRPDSVYVKPDTPNGQRGFQIAYSHDKQHWQHIGVNLFESDYGPWGSEKKLYHPVLSYDGKVFRATFIPNPKIAQIATTDSRDFALWKPQDYPTVPQADFQALLERQRKASENNVIRVPFSAVQALLNKKNLADANWAKESENFVATGARLAAANDITARLTVHADQRKAISPDLMGVFFEDISYAADGGLYAELVQNRDFEYTDADHGGWNAQTAWKLNTQGNATWSISTDSPIHKNNSHYAVITSSDNAGAELVNSGFDGIVLNKGEKYDVSLFLKSMDGKSHKVQVMLKDGDEVLAQTSFSAAGGWKRQKKTLTVGKDVKNANLVVAVTKAGSIGIDFVSLFPRNTYKGRANGLRRDLAEAIADMKPRFVRFPGGCATHGQGIDNIYHWQASVGELWERQPDLNIWHYHQSRGLGFYEYFLFCEDMGAEPLPVLAAGVPCQNSWRGGNGQQGGIPFEAELGGKPSPYTYNGKPLTMESYLQELLDLIEWANGDAKTSKLAAMRAKAGHPKPFGMKYLGIGNEDLISDVFLKRYHYLVNEIKARHPEITIVGTVGPFWEGSDYEYGWDAARENKNIAIVDEHYYNSPGWYFHHRDFYDRYDRNGTKVYLGEWASKGNNASNALVEAAYLTNVERNADVVTMSSYAPMLAKDGHTNWTPSLIYFNNTEVKPSTNYYVQRAFGQNAGDEYLYSDLTVDYASADGRKPLLADIEKRIDRSVVVDSRTGDLIIKLVSLMPQKASVSLDIPAGYDVESATVSVLSQPDQPDRSKSFAVNETRKLANISALELPAYSLVVVRLHSSVK